MRASGFRNIPDESFGVIVYHDAAWANAILEDETDDYFKLTPEDHRAGATNGRPFRNQPGTEGEASKLKGGITDRRPHRLRGHGQRERGHRQLLDWRLEVKGRATGLPVDLRSRDSGLCGGPGRRSVHEIFLRDLERRSPPTCRKKAKGATIVFVGLSLSLRPHSQARGPSCSDGPAARHRFGGAKTEPPQ